MACEHSIREMVEITITTNGFCPICEHAELTSLRASQVALVEALKPFAAYADPKNKMPPDMIISNGTPMARRQLHMGDCYNAKYAIEKSQERTSMGEF